MARALGPAGKAIFRAANVGGNPALAENNIVAPSIEAYARWLSQIANPTSTITPSGEDINEVILSQKDNSITRTPKKWFDGYIRSLSTVPGSKSLYERAVDKWERNWPFFVIPLAKVVGLPQVMSGVAQTILWFVGDDERYKKYPQYLMFIEVNDPGNHWRPDLGHQPNSALIGILIRTITKILQAMQAGVGEPEISAFSAVQEARINTAGTPMINVGTLQVFFITDTPNLRIDVHAGI